LANWGTRAEFASNGRNYAVRDDLLNRGDTSQSVAATGPREN